jgi:hypothetical protein
VAATWRWVCVAGVQHADQVICRSPVGRLDALTGA